MSASDCDYEVFQNLFLTSWGDVDSKKVLWLGLEIPTPSLLKFEMY